MECSHSDVVVALPFLLRANGFRVILQFLHVLLLHTVGCAHRHGAQEERYQRASTQVSSARQSVLTSLLKNHSLVRRSPKPTSAKSQHTLRHYFPGKTRRVGLK